MILSSSGLPDLANGEGPKLRAIASKSLTELDGFYTFLVGTKMDLGCYEIR